MELRPDLHHIITISLEGITVVFGQQPGTDSQWMSKNET